MKKTLVLAAIALVTSFSTSAHAAPPDASWHTRGINAWAGSWSSDGCVNTYIYVAGSENANKTGPGSPATSNVVWVQINREDWCSGEFLYAYGEVSGAFSAKNLQSASAVATIPATSYRYVCDENWYCEYQDTGITDAQVSVQWTGVGEVMNGLYNNHYSSGQYRSHSHGNGQTREATVSISADFGGEQLAVDGVSGSISKHNSGGFEVWN